MLDETKTEVSSGSLVDGCANYTKNVDKLRDLGLTVTYVPLMYEQGIKVPAKVTSYFNWIFQMPVGEEMMALRSHYIKGPVLHHMILHNCGPGL